MANNTAIKIIFGGASFMAGDVAEVEKLLLALEEEGVKLIDTAAVYGKSEEVLGATNAASRFTIDTKFGGGLIPGEKSKEDVVKSGEESLRKLKTDSVDVYYIHAPDRKTPLPEILAGINALHKSGSFKRFGLSNFRADEVEDVIRVAKENNYILPSVYQGNYSAACRQTETELFPTLRKHNIAFYAYSPIAGGFLTKSPEQIRNPAPGRWDPNNSLGKLYQTLYNKPAMLHALELWEEIAKEEGISKAELAYRWVAYNSHLRGGLGDAIIIGSKDVDQLKQTLTGLKNGPLSKEAVRKIDEVWRGIEHEAPLDNFNGYISIHGI